MISGINELELRQQIRAVRNNPNLNAQEMAQQCQRLMCLSISELASREKYAPNESLTCKHYNKNCSRFEFQCCGTIDPCSRCHYAREICDQRPPQISTIKCNLCHTTQAPTQSCINCNVQFSNSYCETCKIWTALEIFHCDGCGICRVGKRDDTFHCYNCDACFPVATRNLHHCAKTQLKDSSCPLCLESVHTAQKESFILPCGHVLHVDCWKLASVKGEYRCPTCRKCLLDMRNIWANIRRSIQLQPIPDNFFPIQIGDVVESPFGQFKVVERRAVTSGNSETVLWFGFLLNWVLANKSPAEATLREDVLVKKQKKRLIWCYDCESKSSTDFHFLGLECKNCGGFNTCQL